jgi:predicted transcriptional regulator of viral defense system
MRQAEAYAQLRSLDGQVVTTREAAALWRTEEGTARRRLQSLAEAGLVVALRRGLWSLDTELDPFALAPYLTAPFPAYVSTFSALAAHAMIEQIPGRVSLASLDRTRRIQTAIGTFDVHHIAPELFGGFTGWRRGGSIASPEKALFDLVYLRAAAGGRAYLPELTLPEGFEHGALRVWADRIGSPSLRTIVERRLGELVGEPANAGQPARR